MESTWCAQYLHDFLERSQVHCPWLMLRWQPQPMPISCIYYHHPGIAIRICREKRYHQQKLENIFRGHGNLLSHFGPWNKSSNFIVLNHLRLVLPQKFSQLGHSLVESGFNFNVPRVKVSFPLKINRGLPCHHLKQPWKIGETREITKGLATWQSLGLILSCNGWCEHGGPRKPTWSIHARVVTGQSAPDFHWRWRCRWCLPCRCRRCLLLLKGPPPKKSRTLSRLLAQ